MKRVLLILIILFPVAMLAFWVYWGFTHSPKTPPGVIQTNSTPTNAPHSALRIARSAIS